MNSPVVSDTLQGAGKPASIRAGSISACYQSIASVGIWRLEHVFAVSALLRFAPICACGRGILTTLQGIQTSWTGAASRPQPGRPVASNTGKPCWRGCEDAMAKDRAAEYREQAETCRRHAAAATRAQDKAAWLKLAGQWQTLAEQVEGS
jgi:hypothetical protein